MFHILLLPSNFSLFHPLHTLSLNYLLFIWENQVIERGLSQVFIAYLIDSAPSLLLLWMYHTGSLPRAIPEVSHETEIPFPVFFTQGYCLAILSSLFYIVGFPAPTWIVFISCICPNTVPFFIIIYRKLFNKVTYSLNNMTKFWLLYLEIWRSLVTLLITFFSLKLFLHLTFKISYSYFPFISLVAPSQSPLLFYCISLACKHYSVTNLNPWDSFFSCS